MRFSRFQLILMVAVVALLGVNVFLATGYFSAASRKTSLQSDIDAKEKVVAAMPDQADVDALTRQRDEAMRQLTEEADIPSALILEDEPLEPHIIYVMQKAGIDFYAYNPGSAKAEIIGGGTYSAHTYSITNVREQLSRLLRLLVLIEELPYPTLAIRDVKLTSAGETWSLVFKIVIITQ